MINYKVDFALLLYDEFDGAPITDPNVLFRCDGRVITPLRKREGFYVFRGLDIPDVELEISRPHYHKNRKRIIKSCLDPGNPIERVRLTREYPGVFSDCEWLHGRCPPNSEVLAFSGEGLKLQIGAERDRLTILGQTAGNLLGRRFAPGKKSTDTFLLTRMLAPGVYLSDRELADAPKASRIIIRAYLSKSGSDGKYHIPIERGSGENISETAYYDGGEGKWVYVSATARS